MRRFRPCLGFVPTFRLLCMVDAWLSRPWAKAMENRAEADRWLESAGKIRRLILARLYAAPDAAFTTSTRAINS